MEKILNTRIINKHDIEAKWLEAANFIPKQGELIVYDIDATHDYERIKIGDGITPAKDLPFIYEPVTIEDIEEICGANIISGEEAQL